ncbi:MAG TPA: AmmeMemoRadiSam system protein B, partial [Vicinamibacteria bacterium]
MGPAVRKAAVAGSWYPGTAAAVSSAVEGYLAAAGAVSAPGRLVALLCPHAGLRYSGPVAAYGYSLLRGRGPTTVVLVGPSHHAHFDG